MARYEIHSIVGVSCARVRGDLTLIRFRFRSQAEEKFMLETTDADAIIRFLSLSSISGIPKGLDVQAETVLSEKMLLLSQGLLFEPDGAARSISEVRLARNGIKLADADGSAVATWSYGRISLVVVTPDSGLRVDRTCGRTLHMLHAPPLFVKILLLRVRDSEQRLHFAGGSEVPISPGQDGYEWAQGDVFLEVKTRNNQNEIHWRRWFCALRSTPTMENGAVIQNGWSKLLPSPGSVVLDCYSSSEMKRLLFSSVLDVRRHPRNGVVINSKPVAGTENEASIGLMVFLENEADPILLCFKTAPEAAVWARAILNALSSVE